jgi:hemoglobin
MNTSFDAQTAMNANPITEEAIARLVDRFYAKIRTDAELGPIFARAIPGDWGPHLATMRNFWSSVMLTSGGYKGNPVAVHQRVEGIELRLFDRWLALFDQTCDELFDAPIATAFRTKARRIAESLKLTLFYRPDRPWPQNQSTRTSCPLSSLGYTS